jgi:prephenate dehydrogenase
VPELTITLVLGAYAFAAGGYVFTFRYIQSSTKALWAAIQELRENDLHSLEQRIERLERDR